MQPCANPLMHSIAFHSPGESLADEALIFQVKLNTGWGGAGAGKCDQGAQLVTGSQRSQVQAPGLHKDKPTKEERQEDRLVPSWEWRNSQRRKV